MALKKLHLLAFVCMEGGVALGQDDLHARAKAILSRLHERQTAGLHRRSTVASDSVQSVPVDHFLGRRSQHDGIASTPAEARPGFGARAAKPYFVLDSGQTRATMGARSDTGDGSESIRLRAPWTTGPGQTTSFAPPDRRLQPRMHHA